VGHGDKNPENQAVWAWFLLMHGSEGRFCPGGNLFGLKNINDI
jgi:hypothetical protein